MPPARLPNSLIYLISLFRPYQLRPDLRVPSIAHVDFPALRRKGFNAIVIDKDNCLTIPYQDDVYPPYKPAWDELVATFHPGRILVVSNSAGTKKDPGGIAAEALALSLQVPVLNHKINKPGCSNDIISYFRGQLGRPQTLRHLATERALAGVNEEHEDERELLERWRGEVESGPLLGPITPREAKKGGEDDGGEYGLEKRMIDREKKGRQEVAEAKEKAKQGKEVKLNETVEESQSNPTTLAPSSEEKPEDPLRMVVIGDRLFTDVLLGHRLSLHLNSNRKNTSTDPYPDTPTVLSIHTTSLPEPKDVTILRYIEERLSGGLLKSGKTDWGRYILSEPIVASPLESLAESKRSAEKPIPKQPEMSNSQGLDVLPENRYSDLPKRWRLSDFFITAMIITFQWIGEKSRSAFQRISSWIILRVSHSSASTHEDLKSHSGPSTVIHQSSGLNQSSRPTIKAPRPQQSRQIYTGSSTNGNPSKHSQNPLNSRIKAIVKGSMKSIFSGGYEVIQKISYAALPVLGLVFTFMIVIYTLRWLGLTDPFKTWLEGTEFGKRMIRDRENEAKRREAKTVFRSYTAVEHKEMNEL